MAIRHHHEHLHPPVPVEVWGGSEASAAQR